MNRNRWLFGILILLAIANIAYYIHSHWGLITVHAEDRPLAEVIRSIEKQGHISLKTDLDPTMKVRMHVEKVPLAEALETLSTLTEARCRLTYIFAGDRGAIQGVISAITGGQKPEDWKTIYYPLPPISPEDPGIPPDPRRDTWNVKPTAERTLQAYLEAAGRNVSAAFVVPTTWNPPIASEPKSGEIRKVAPKLASAAHGKVEEVFLLQKQQRRGGGPPGGDGDGGPRMMGGFAAMGERLMAEIEKLPPDKREAAQKEIEEFRAMRDLPPEERRAKMEDFFQRDDVQERMEKRDAEREKRSSPEQRVKRAHQYLDRKAKIRAGDTK